MPAFSRAGSAPAVKVTVAPRARNQQPKWHYDEKNISAEQAQASSHSRISRPDGHEGWPPRAKAPSRQRPGQADALSNCGQVLLVTESKATVGSDTEYRLRRKHRLLDKQSFGRVFNNARRSRDNMFTVLYRPNDADEARLGLAIGKKNCKLASGRNRLKRIIRESFRQHRGQLAGLDIVVLNQPAAASASNATLFASLARHWKRCTSGSADKAR